MGMDGCGDAAKYVEELLKMSERMDLSLSGNGQILNSKKEIPDLEIIAENPRQIPSFKNTSEYPMEMPPSNLSKDERIAEALLSWIKSESRKSSRREMRWESVQNYYIGKEFRSLFPPSFTDKDFPFLESIVTHLQHSGDLSFHSKSEMISLQEPDSPIGVTTVDVSQNGKNVSSQKNGGVIVTHVCSLFIHF